MILTIEKVGRSPNGIIYIKCSHSLGISYIDLSNETLVGKVTYRLLNITEKNSDDLEQRIKGLKLNCLVEIEKMEWNGGIFNNPVVKQVFDLVI